MRALFQPDTQLPPNVPPGPTPMNSVVPIAPPDDPKPDPVRQQEEQVALGNPNANSDVVVENGAVLVEHNVTADQQSDGFNEKKEEPEE